MEQREHNVEMKAMGLIQEFVKKFRSIDLLSILLISLASLLERVATSHGLRANSVRGIPQL